MSFRQLAFRLALLWMLIMVFYKLCVSVGYCTGTPECLSDRFAGQQPYAESYLLLKSIGGSYVAPGVTFGSHGITLSASLSLISPDRMLTVGIRVGRRR